MDAQFAILKAPPQCLRGRQCYWWVVSWEESRDGSREGERKGKGDCGVLGPEARLWRASRSALSSPSSVPAHWGASVPPETTQAQSHALATWQPLYLSKSPTSYK